MTVTCSLGCCRCDDQPFQRGMSGRLSFTVAAFSKLVRPFVSRWREAGRWTPNLNPTRGGKYDLVKVFPITHNTRGAPPFCACSDDMQKHSCLWGSVEMHVASATPVENEPAP